MVETFENLGLFQSSISEDPVLAVSGFESLDQALAHVNLHTGYKEPSMPFGGFKQSGAGLPENSESGLEFFVDRKLSTGAVDGQPPLPTPTPPPPPRRVP